MSKNGKKWPKGFREKANGALLIVVTIDGTNYTRLYDDADRSEHLLLRARRTFQVEKEQALLRAKATGPVALPEIIPADALTFDALGKQFVETLTGARQRDVKNFLVRWSERLDPHPTHRVLATEITSVMVDRVLAEWKREHIAHWTRHALRAALNQCYNTVLGRRGYNPVKDSGTKWRRPKDTVARGIRYDIIDRILEQVPDYQWVGQRAKLGQHGPLSKAKIVLKLMSLTGLTPHMLDGVNPDDLNLKARTVYVERRDKGEGATVGTIPFRAEAVPVWKLFIERDCFHDVKARSVARAFAVGLAKAATEWAKSHRQPFPVPPNCRPYDLRHSFATHMYRETGDLPAVAKLLGHAEGSPVTQRYVQGAIDDRALKAVAKTAAPLFAKRKAVA